MGSGLVSWSQSTFTTWGGPTQNTSDYALIINSGDVMVNGCYFLMPGNQINLFPYVSKAVVVGNIFAGSSKITNSCKNAQIGLNVWDL